MTTFSNSEGSVITHTNGFLETILLTLISSNSYYTSGENDIILTKIGSNKMLLLDYTYYINRNILQNYTINELMITIQKFFFNNTSNGYILQGVYNANSYIGAITELSQVYLATYDTNAQPFVYTGSENIETTDNQISLKPQIKINYEIVLSPRAYDNAVFEMISGTGSFAFLQNTNHGGQPIAQFYSSTEACTFHGDRGIPNMYNNTCVNILIADIYNDIYF